MKVYELIKILANVCKYNAEGEVWIEDMDGRIFPLDRCINDHLEGDPKTILMLKGI